MIRNSTNYQSATLYYLYDSKARGFDHLLVLEATKTRCIIISCGKWILSRKKFTPRMFISLCPNLIVHYMSINNLDKLNINYNYAKKVLISKKDLYIMITTKSYYEHEEDDEFGEYTRSLIPYI